MYRKEADGWMKHLGLSCWIWSACKSRLYSPICSDGEGWTFIRWTYTAILASSLICGAVQGHVFRKRFMASSGGGIMREFLATARPDIIIGVMTVAFADEEQTRASRICMGLTMLFLPDDRLSRAAFCSKQMLKRACPSAGTGLCCDYDTEYRAVGRRSQTKNYEMYKSPASSSG